MSVKHPIIAVTGSTGAGTTTVRNTFAGIFLRERIGAAFVHGSAFRRYDQNEVGEVYREAAEHGMPISDFGPEGNLFDRLEGLFREYSRTGTGLTREFIETDEQASYYKRSIGSYSAWEEVAPGSDLLFYEGQHGGCIEATWSRRAMSQSHNPLIIQERHKLQTRQDSGVDVAQWVDLLIGVVPSINLEWIQKINQVCSKHGCSSEQVTRTILRRLRDYVRYMTPQFSLTDINFQRVPLVDTSNPFIAREVPSLDESMVVIRFREPKRHDFPYLLNRINRAFMSRPNTLVVPGGEMKHAMDIICTPLVRDIVEKSRT